eukprot:c28333_g1_i1 orf=3-275(+)
MAIPYDYIETWDGNGDTKMPPFPRSSSLECPFPMTMSHPHSRSSLELCILFKSHVHHVELDSMDHRLELSSGALWFISSLLNQCLIYRLE